MFIKFKSQIFEYIFNNILNKNIRKDFVTNGYKTFYTEIELNSFGEKNKLYFTIKEAKLNLNWNEELYADYKNDKRAIEGY